MNKTLLPTIKAPQWMLSLSICSGPCCSGILIKLFPFIEKTAPMQRISKRYYIGHTLALLACVFALALCIGCSSNDNPTDISDEDELFAVKVDAIPAQKHIPESENLSAEDLALSTISSEVVQGEENLIVRFIDVGQGDAALITCDGESLLIDGGPVDASSKMYSVLRNLGIEKLDYVVVTHPDADHCGGISGALNYAECKTMYCSVKEYDTRTFKNVLKYLGNTSVTVPVAGDSFQLGGAVVEFVAPVVHTGDLNNDSLVCKIIYGHRSFIFTGDAGLGSEDVLIGSGADVDVDVLKVGHHGSDTATSQLFLNKVTPEYAVISVGSNNYGHPASDVLQRLAASDVQVLRTDELGTIIIETDGKGLAVSNTKGNIER